MSTVSVGDANPPECMNAFSEFVGSQVLAFELPAHIFKIHGGRSCRPTIGALLTVATLPGPSIKLQQRDAASTTVIDVPIPSFLERLTP